VFHSKIKSKLVVLVLLVFIGQVSASVAFSACQMSLPDNQQYQNDLSSDTRIGISAAGMDHSSHAMNMQESDSDFSNSMNCCDSDSDCSMSGCISLALFSTYDGFSSSFLTTSVVLETEFPITQFPRSLYRPPILS